MATENGSKLKQREEEYLFLPMDSSVDRWTGVESLVCDSHVVDEMRYAHKELCDVTARAIQGAVHDDSDGSVIAETARQVANAARVLGDLEGYRRGRLELLEALKALHSLHALRAGRKPRKKKPTTKKRRKAG